MYAVCYVLWLVIVAISVAALFVFRETVVPLLSLIVGPTPWAQAIILLGTLIAGMVLAIGALGSEPYLRHGVERGQLMRNFTQLALPLVLVCGVGLLIQWLASSVL
jgi:hypothetical protein